MCEGGPSTDPAEVVRPCQCTGTCAYAHKRCLEQWILEKGCRRCEVCKGEYNTEALTDRAQQRLEWPEYRDEEWALGNALHSPRQTRGILMLALLTLLSLLLLLAQDELTDGARAAVPTISDGTARDYLAELGIREGAELHLSAPSPSPLWRETDLHPMPFTTAGPLPDGGLGGGLGGGGLGGGGLGGGGLERIEGRDEMALINSPPEPAAAEPAAAAAEAGALYYSSSEPAGGMGAGGPAPMPLPPPPPPPPPSVEEQLRLLIRKEGCTEADLHPPSVAEEGGRGGGRTRCEHAELVLLRLRREVERAQAEARGRSAEREADEAMGRMTRAFILLCVVRLLIAQHARRRLVWRNQALHVQAE